MLEDAIKDIIVDTAVQEFENSKLAEYINKVMSLIEQTEEHVQALAEKSNEKDLTLMKIGTIVTLGIAGQLYNGKKPKDFSEEDWKEIAKGVSQYAILMDDQAYSEFVFEIYANYLEASANKYSKVFSEKTTASVLEVVSEIRLKGEQLEAGIIKEVDYTEDCLWLCLEGMIKLLSAYYSSKLGKEYGELAQAISALTFECARYSMYKQRQEILAMYLEKQHELDEELQAKCDAYIAQLKENSEVFNKLIDEAFNPDFRNTLRNSVELARFVGVKEEEIMKSTKDVDDFFLN